MIKLMQDLDRKRRNVVVEELDDSELVRIQITDDKNKKPRVLTGRTHFMIDGDNVTMYKCYDNIPSIVINVSDLEQMREIVLDKVKTFNGKFFKYYEDAENGLVVYIKEIGDVTFVGYGDTDSAAIADIENTERLIKGE